MLRLAVKKIGMSGLVRSVLVTGKTILFWARFIFLGTEAVASDWPEFPVPLSAEVVLVGEELNINGLPTRIWELSSNETPEEVLDFYRGQWQEPTAPDAPGFIENEASGWQIVSRSEEPYLLTVQVSEAAMGSTAGFLAISRPMDLVDHEMEAFEKPAGSEVLLDLASDDAGKRGRVVQFRNRQSIEANYRFYRQRYLANGWIALSELPPDRDKALLLMNKGDRKVSLVLNRMDADSYGVLVESHD